jgi:hypothetical protein
MAISLLDRDPRSVTFQELEDFLTEGHPESDRLDYKQEIVDSVADTMVAFANTGGGIVIGGVAEDKNTKKPKTWDGVSQKNPLGTLANYVSMFCSPAVRYEVVSIENPASKKPLILIHVSQSLRRPHMTKSSGVLARVDDQNRPADIDSIRRWVLWSEADQADADNRLLRSQLVPSSSGLAIGGAFCLVVTARPITRIVPLALTENTDRTIKEMLEKYLHLALLPPQSWAGVEPAWRVTSRGQSFVEFYNGERRLYSWIGSDAVTEFTAHWPQPSSGVNPEVDLIEFISTLYRFLFFQMKLLRDVFGFPDDVRVKVRALNVNGTKLLMPVVGQVLPFFGQVPNNVEYNLTLADEAAAESETLEALLALFRDAQVLNYETHANGLMVVASRRGLLPTMTTPLPSG